MSAQTLKGPLTAFDPPSSCFNQLWYNSRSDKVLGNPYDTRCKPSGWNTNVKYSPALCPSSYYSADGRLATAGTVVETVIDCCPSSFTADPGTFHCLSPIDVFRTAVFFTFSSDQSVFTATLTSPSFGVNAHSIQVRFQSSDLQLLSLASDTTATPAIPTASSVSTTSQSLIPIVGSTGASSTTSSPTFVSSPASTSSPTPTADPSSGLSTGAKAGVGAGIACGMILVLVAIWLVIRARKSKLVAAKQPPHYEYHDELPAEKHSGQAPLSELAVPVSELPSPQTPSRTELSAT